MAHVRDATNMSRRNLMRRAGAAAIIAALGPDILSITASAAERSAITPDQALRRLLAGNRRHATGRAQRPNQSVGRRREVAGGQRPFATILACADSRVPPELVFDQGLGDLFVVRVAGNIVDDAVLGSVEFGAEELHIPLVVVLGHEKCGAVAAAVSLAGEAPGHIGSLVKPIKPAVEAARGQPGDLLDNAVRANVGLSVRALRTSTPILADLVREGRLKIVGARYDLDSGVVTVIG